MGLDNPIHIAFLLVILLLVFGAKRLPEMGHSLGSGLRGFKESLSGRRVSPHERRAPTPIRLRRRDGRPRTGAPRARRPQHARGVARLPAGLPRCGLLKTPRSIAHDDT